MKTLSESIQKLIVLLGVLTVLIGLPLIVGHTAMAYQATEQGKTLELVSSAFVPSCEVLRANGYRYVESQDDYGISVDELCE